MSHWRKFALLPAVAGLALGLIGLTAGSASAQSFYFGGNAASVTCPGWPTSTCTVTLDQFVPAGESLEVTLPDDQTQLTVSCSNGCFPGQSFSVTVSPSVLATGVQQYVTPSGCFAGEYGCSTAFMSIPPVSQYAYSYTYAAPSVVYSPPAYVQPPAFYPSTPSYSNGYWWSWDNDNGWSWSHHGNHWHPWNH